jgi:hypothetical protein
MGHSDVVLLMTSAETEPRGGPRQALRLWMGRMVGRFPSVTFDKRTHF